MGGLGDRAMILGNTGTNGHGAVFCQRARQLVNRHFHTGIGFLQNHGVVENGIHGYTIPEHGAEGNGENG